MIIKANCKINIGLDIVRRRADGYHELSTLIYPIYGLYDLLTVEASDKGVSFSSLGLNLDCAAEDNLCVRAATMMQQRYAVAGVTITLDKRVPFGAGLGGGSSDATSVILAIDEIYGLQLPEDELIALAAELGSDTPFFVRNTPQLCSGRGEIMEPFPLDLKGKRFVIVKPEIHISTREAYAGVSPTVPQTPLSELLALPIEQWQGRVKNDFEPHLFAAHPLLAQVKQALLTAGAQYVSMSGSGSTIYGIFDRAANIDLSLLEPYSPMIL